MTLLEEIITDITEKNPRHGKKLRKTISVLDDTFKLKSNSFFNKYNKFVKEEGKTIEYGINCYLKMIGVMMHEQVEFARTGEYSCKSFEEANKNVYNNPEVMEYYMHGLLMSQFLWKHHYNVLEFFIKTIESLKTKKTIKNYLEIGGGHGLCLSEAIKLLKGDTKFTCVDISPSSLNIAKRFVDNPNIDYKLANIFEYEPEVKYDMITMGEVLEHVEDPVALLKRLGVLLKSDGVAFITTPTNSATIDHIYLFRNAQEIIEVINAAGFEVVEDYKIYSEDVSEEKAIAFKVPMMYAALIKKND